MCHTFSFLHTQMHVPQTSEAAHSPTFSVSCRVWNDIDRWVRVISEIHLTIWKTKTEEVILAENMESLQDGMARWTLRRYTPKVQRNFSESIGDYGSLQSQEHVDCHSWGELYWYPGSSKSLSLIPYSASHSFNFKGFHANPRGLCPPAHIWSRTLYDIKNVEIFASLIWHWLVLESFFSDTTLLTIKGAPFSLFPFSWCMQTFLQIQNEQTYCQLPWREIFAQLPSRCPLELWVWNILKWPRFGVNFFY